MVTYRYMVTLRQLKTLGLHRLFRLNGGLCSVLEKVYPDQSWHPWRFPVTSKTLWRDPVIVRRALQYVEQALDIKTQDDWYFVHDLVDMHRHLSSSSSVD